MNRVCEIMKPRETNRGQDKPQVGAGVPGSAQIIVNLLKSILHNIGVLGVGFGVAFLGVGLDRLLHLTGFQFSFATIAGWILLAVGFLLRVWAAFYFYQKRMKVISLSPQNSLVTTGPYRLSRNPLYLGGNVFIFFGAALVLKTPSGLIITALQIPVVDAMIRREEKQLEQAFGEEWERYRSRVRRWL